MVSSHCHSLYPNLREVRIAVLPNSRETDQGQYGSAEISSVVSVEEAKVEEAEKEDDTASKNASEEDVDKDLDVETAVIDAATDAEEDAGSETESAK